MSLWWNNWVSSCASVPVVFPTGRPRKGSRGVQTLFPGMWPHFLHYYCLIDMYIGPSTMSWRRSLLLTCIILTFAFQMSIPLILLRSLMIPSCILSLRIALVLLMGLTSLPLSLLRINLDFTTEGGTSPRMCWLPVASSCTFSMF